MKQGEPLSPVLFNCALEEIFKKISWTMKGLVINGERITNLDDVALLSSSIINFVFYIVFKIGILE